MSQKPYLDATKVQQQFPYIGQLELFDFGGQKIIYKGIHQTYGTIMLKFFKTNDQKTSLTLFALDEYLSFAQNLDSETIEGLHTRIRSKGGCLLPGVQYFPEQSNKADSAQGITQKMLNSAAYWFLFQGVDEYTLKKINTTIGKVRYRKEQIREQLVADPLNRKNYQIEEADLLNTSLFQSLGQNYEHITFVPSKRILYKGYTPRAELPIRKENYLQSENIERYYQRKY